MGSNLTASGEGKALNWVLLRRVQLQSMKFVKATLSQPLIFSKQVAVAGLQNMCPVGYSGYLR